jgi:hypothetical protein
MRGMTERLLPAVLAVFAVTQAVPASAREDRAAETTARLVEQGTWQFAARATNADGLPECTETWQFNADGSASVQSGQQRIEETWRIEEDAEQLLWLHTTPLSSTAGPDCLGNMEDPATFLRPERSIVLLFFNSGGAMTCQPPDLVQGPDGKPVQAWGDHTCWGTIAPLGQSIDDRAWRFTAPGENAEN